MWPHSLFGTRHVALALAFVGLCRTGLAEPSYEELCQQGRKHLLAAEYAEAEDVFSKAVKIDSARSLAYVGQALAFRATQQYDRAVDAASKAITEDPNDVTALVIRGTAYHALKKHALAKKDFDDAIEHDPNEAAAYAGRGRVYLDQKDEKGAMFDFSKAIEFRKDDHQTYVARAKLYRRQGRFGNARRDLEHAIRLRPQSAPYHFLLAQTHFDNRNYDPAIEAASKVIELSDEFPVAYVLKGAALYHQGKHDEALTLLKKAKHDAPMDAGVFLWLG